MSGIGLSIAALVTAAFGLAIVAVLVSKQAQTPQVLQAFGQGLGTIIGAAVAPVTGGGGVSTSNSGSQLNLGNYFNAFGSGSFAQ